MLISSLRAPLVLTLCALGAPALAQSCDPAWIPTPSLNLPVRGLTVLPTGEAVAVGSFTVVGSTNFGSGVARWNPGTNTWSTVGGEPSTALSGGDAYAITRLSSGDLIVGGAFNFIAGNVPAKSLARWNATTNTWAPIGAGLQGGPIFPTCNALVTLQDGDVLVGGSFGTAGAASASNIARLNTTTSTFSTLGLGTSGDVNALAVLPNGDVIVGGAFTLAGGASAGRVARYRPSTNTWFAMGTGVAGGDVLAILALPSGDAIVGGSFTSAGGVASTGRIARWNAATNSWSALGGGLNASVSSITQLPGGNLIAGGVFSIPGGGQSIARFSFATSTWTSLGQLDGIASALAVLPTGELLAGGNFLNADGRSSPNIARYTFNNLPAFATQPAPQSVTGGALATFTAVPVVGYAIRQAQWQLETAPGSGVYASLSTGPIAGSAATAVISLPGPLPQLPGPTTLSIVGADASLSGRRVRAAITNECNTVTSQPALLTATGGGTGGTSCYANCDNSTVAPVLNASDFSCFLTRFRAGCP